MSKALHFYPGQKTMLWLVNGELQTKVEAWGGADPAKGANDPIMKPRKTTPGIYVIHSVAPYKTRTWPWSRIPWGTPIMLSADTGRLVYSTGIAKPAWKNVEDLIPGVTPKVVMDRHEALYGVRKIPATWVFNDFGPKAIRYYKDLNDNKKLDKGESLSGEMIHTTPENEASAAKGEDVALTPSHGCVHLKPGDRDRLESDGAFAKGTTLVIHRYDEALPKKYQ